MNYPIVLAILFTFVFFAPGVADPTPPPDPIHKAVVGKDGFPTGSDSPEGAACDLARAFIQHDGTMFLATCWPSTNPDYRDFLNHIVESMKAEAAKATPSPGGPKSIGKCFAARFLSKDGPASYGYATFNLQQVMFVDVGVLLQNGDRKLNRTLVVENSAGKWLVVPRPDLFPFLSGPLNQDGPSAADFTQR